MQPALIGFTLLRNGLKYDYPFRESLRGLSELCGEVVVALGKSEDGTEAVLRDWPGLHLIPTVWDEAKRQGGVILSEQTNIALNEARRRAPSAWGFYLQADECISEADFARIRADIARADAEGYDCISFRYLHFWQNYEAIAVNKRWYPQEIRAVKLSSSAESYGDAQSFRGWTKRFESDAVIYHYGHVREAGAYEKKKRDFHRWWHPDAELKEVIAKGEKNDRTEETVRYLGPHPRSMAERIAAHGGLSQPPRRKVFVYGEPSSYPTPFLDRVSADLLWTSDERELLDAPPADTVALAPLPFWLRLRGLGRFRSRVPEGMRSPQARPWTEEFRALLKFSEKGVRVGATD